MRSLLYVSLLLSLAACDDRPKTVLPERLLDLAGVHDEIPAEWDLSDDCAEFYRGRGPVSVLLISSDEARDYTQYQHYDDNWIHFPRYMMTPHWAARGGGPQFGGMRIGHPLSEEDLVRFTDERTGFLKDVYETKGTKGGVAKATFYNDVAGQGVPDFYFINWMHEVRQLSDLESLIDERCTGEVGVSDLCALSNYGQDKLPLYEVFVRQKDKMVRDTYIRCSNYDGLHPQCDHVKAVVEYAYRVAFFYPKTRLDQWAYLDRQADMLFFCSLEINQTDSVETDPLADT